MNDRRLNIIQRINKRCKLSDHGYHSPCHVWTGPTSGKGRGGGYGRMSLNGQTCAVHIVMYTCYNGYVPSNKQIDHLCNNRLCCNPDHLEMVTHRENQKRRAKRSIDNVRQTTS